jgi:hypothetical protein
VVHKKRVPDSRKTGQRQLLTSSALVGTKKCSPVSCTGKPEVSPSIQHRQLPQALTQVPYNDKDWHEPCSISGNSSVLLSPQVSNQQILRGCEVLYQQLVVGNCEHAQQEADSRPGQGAAAQRPPQASRSERTARKSLQNLLKKARESPQGALQSGGPVEPVEAPSELPALTCITNSGQPQKSKNAPRTAPAGNPPRNGRRGCSSDDPWMPSGVAGSLFAAEDSGSRARPSKSALIDDLAGLVRQRKRECLDMRKSGRLSMHEDGDAMMLMATDFREL